MPHRVKDDLGFLAGSRIVQVDEWLAVHLLLQDGKIFADFVNIDSFGGRRIDGETQDIVTCCCHKVVSASVLNTPIIVLISAPDAARMPSGWRGLTVPRARSRL